MLDRLSNRNAPLVFPFLSTSAFCVGASGLPCSALVANALPDVLTPHQSR